MKQFLCLCAFVVCAFSAGAQSIITGTVTLTNAAGTTNGQTITINGHLRTWTNSVTSASTQLQTSANTNYAGSNMFLSYVAFPEANMTVSHPASNVVRFTSFPGSPLAITIFSNWANLSLVTNVMTNATLVRVPKSVAGPYERTNVASGLVAWLNDPAVTNRIDTNAPAFADFHPPDLAGLTNYINGVGLNCTNFTTNAVLTLSNNVRPALVFFTNQIATLGSAAYASADSFQPACAILTDICENLTTLDGLSYLDVSGNIVLKQHSETYGDPERFRANIDGNASVNWEDGAPGYVLNASDHSIRDQDHAGTARFYARDAADSGGSTYLRAADGRDSFILKGDVDSVHVGGAVIASKFNWPCTLIGTVTNFVVDGASISTSETAVNQFTMPANTMTNVGDTIIRTIGLQFTTSGSYEVKVYFASVTIFDATFTVASTATMSLTCEVTVDGITSGTGDIRYNCFSVGKGTSTTTFSTVDKANSIDFTTGQLCKVGLIAPGSNNAKVITDNVRLALSSAWAGY